MKSFITTIFLLLFAATSNVLAQSNYVLLDKSTMQIEGTSTIHDWTCDVQELNSDITFDAAALEAETKSTPVQALALTIPVKSIESGKGGMNRKMHGALKEEKHPNISFELIDSKLTEEGTNADSSSFQLVANGKLTIAGTSQDISFPVQGTVQDDGSYKFTGSYELNMKDYNVDPPSAVFGTIKSGEMVTVSFEFYISNNTKS